MSFIDPFAYTATQKKVPVVFMAQKVGLTLILNPPTAPAVKEVKAKHKRQLEQNMRKNRGALNMTIADLEKQADEMILATVIGWEWDEKAVGIGGAKPKYSPESLTAFLAHETFGPALRKQIEDEIQDEAGFLEKAAV